MGLRREIRKSIGSAVKVGRQTATDGVQTFNSWAEARSTDRRMDAFDDELTKAAKVAQEAGNDGTHDMVLSQVKEPAREPKALHFNPFDLVAAMGYRERPSAMTYQALEMVGRGVPVVADIISTRTHQVSVFCQLPEDRHSPGFKVRHRDWRTQPVTPVIQKEQENLEQMMLYTGWHDPSQPQDVTTLREFCHLFVPDALIFDQGASAIRDLETGAGT